MPATRSAPPLTPAAWLRIDAIRRALAEVDARRVLEVGAGMGSMGWRLAHNRAYAGVEPDARSAAVARGRLAGRGDVVTGTAEELPAALKAERFDLICAFEVLEHIPDDRAALDEWAELLRPGGHLLLSVPAHRRRFATGDMAVGHVRRYDRSDLTELLEAGGWRVVRLESWGAGLGHLLEAARNLLARRRSVDAPLEMRSQESGRMRQPRRSAAGFATWAVAAPFRLLQRPLARTSFGIGWVALACRR